MVKAQTALAEVLGQFQVATSVLPTLSFRGTGTLFWLPGGYLNTCVAHVGKQAHTNTHKNFKKFYLLPNMLNKFI